MTPGLGDFGDRGRGGLRPGDLHPALSACHGACLEGHRLRRLQEPLPGPLARGQVHEEGAPSLSLYLSLYTPRPYHALMAVLDNGSNYALVYCRKSRWTSTSPTT